MRNWEDTLYKRIQKVETRNGELSVLFENGDAAKVPCTALIPLGYERPQWDSLRHTPYEIVVPAEPGDFEVPWDRIRALSDQQFSKFLAEKADEYTRNIGEQLKTLRTRRGIKSKELAERAGLTPQTISRIEKGHTDLSFSTLRKILACMGYALQDLAQQESDPKPMKKSLDYLVSKLVRTGIDSDLLTNKIIPPSVQEALKQYEADDPEMILDEAASYVSRVYGWSVPEIWEAGNLIIADRPAAVAYFKAPKNANINQIKAFSHYAYYLATLVTRACSRLEKRQYPSNIDEFKQRLIEKYKTLTFESVLALAWDLGICVIPLSVSGVFHGASWNISSRHVILLKQNTDSHARWAFDLLHELYHVFAHLDDSDTAVIETEGISPFASNDSEEEIEANSLVNQIIFENREEDLAMTCIKVAEGKLQNLKTAVQKVAKEENVDVGFLANYLAFRLGNQGRNWWGAANNLQVQEPRPSIIALEYLSKYISLGSLRNFDRNILDLVLSH